MPKVELTFSALSNINYSPVKVVEFDDLQWEEMDIIQRQQLINSAADRWISEDIGWDYRVIR